MDSQKQINVMSNIMRAAHFEWRRAALAACPGADPMELVLRYWTEVAADTAKYYLRQIDPNRPLPEQFAKLFVGSSQAMQEDCVYTGKDGNGCETVTHRDCPWYHWHKREGLLQEDQPGCDKWLEKTIEAVNIALGTKLRFATLCTIPGGASTCVRKFWTEL